MNDNSQPQTTERVSESWLQYAQTSVDSERQRCAAIVRAHQPTEPRLSWLRDILEVLATEIENG